MDQIVPLAVIMTFTFAAWFSNKVNIGYGKHFSSFIKYTLPPKIGWCLYESPNLLWTIYFAVTGYDIWNLSNLFFISHYINRTIIYPLRISSSSKPIPLEVALSAFIFTSCNGYIQLTNNQSKEINLITIVGILIFLFGVYCNIQCDAILSKLRSTGSYQIPYSNLFEYVSSGHYLGEIIEWFGYWLIAQQANGFLFFFSTLSILSSRAIDSHKWYLNKFENYPKQRKAIIPWLI